VEIDNLLTKLYVSRLVKNSNALRKKLDRGLNLMEWGKYFFEIPIYRISEDRFYKLYDYDLHCRLESYSQSCGVECDQIPERIRRNVEQSFWETYGGPWHFNQTVGWLRLFIWGTQIKGELWMSNAKRLLRKGKRLFRLC
jgi:hypothetical protein